MANFLTAFSITSKEEGGYSNRINDDGGETYKGIARRVHPEWVGWKIIDNNKPLKNGSIINSPTLDGLVEQFYRTEFWQPIHGDLIDSQKIANNIYDWFVNSGREAIIQVQTALNIIADGVVGAKTIQAINTVNENDLNNIIINHRVAFVKDLVRKKPKDAEFLKGWINRAYSFS